MQATIISKRGGIELRVRRASRNEYLDTFRMTKQQLDNLKIGDKIEVVRVTNSPYLKMIDRPNLFDSLTK